jgi:hypothetical protein
MNVLTLITNIDELSKYLTTRDKLNTIKINGKDTELLTAIEKVNELLNECIGNNTCESTFFDSNKEMYDFNLKPIYKLYNYIGIDDRTAKNILESTIGRNILDYGMFYELFTKVLNKLIKSNTIQEKQFYHTKFGKLVLKSNISDTMMFDMVRDLLLNKKCTSANTLDRETLYRQFQFQSNDNYSFLLKLYDKTENESATLEVFDIKNNCWLDVRIDTTNFQSYFDELEKMVITSVQKRILESCVWSSDNMTTYIKSIFG